MPFDFDAFRGDFRPGNWFKLSRYHKDFSKKNPDFFRPDGLILFCGAQGSGKTLSAVRYIDRICKRFPAALVVSNIKLNLDSSNEILPYEGLRALSLMDNGYKGVLCFIDEIQTEFSSLESKKISPSVLAMISQQRKRRCHIVGTSQLFGRVAKPFREQINAAVDCKSLFGGFIQRNSVIDFDTVLEDQKGDLSKYGYRWHSTFIRDPHDFEKYDTFERVYRQGYDY